MSIYRQGTAPANMCPRCRDNLDASVHPGVRTCPRCGGVLADVEATRRIVTALDRTLLEIGFQAGLGKPRHEDRGYAIACPECLVEMQRMRIESAACTVDVCPAHGTWFDPGELEDVMRAYASARKKGAMPPGAVPIAYNPPLGTAETRDDLFDMLADMLE